MDRFVEHTLIPAHTRGIKRKDNPAYIRLRATEGYRRRTGDRVASKRLRQQMMATPSKDPADPAFRRLRYIRYADDFLLGFAGPLHEAEAITRQLGAFLHETLKLELSETKTLITHGRTEAARFRNYELTILGTQRRTRRRSGGMARSASGGIGLKVPLDVIREKRRPYLARGQPIHRIERVNDAVFSIIRQYESEFRGSRSTTGWHTTSIGSRH